TVLAVVPGAGLAAGGDGCMAGGDGCIAGCDHAVAATAANAKANAAARAGDGSCRWGADLRANEIAVFSMAFLTAWSAAVQHRDCRRAFLPARNPGCARRRVRSTRCHRAADRTFSFHPT